MNRFSIALWRTCIPVALCGLLAACTPPAPAEASVRTASVSEQPVSVDAAPLFASAPCTGTFVAHDLPHVTQAPGPTTRLFDSNGAGVAVNDLDGDGDEDLVLANLSAPASILWNMGGLRFERQELPLIRRARAVAIVDVTGDGQQDIVFTTGASAPAVMENQGNHAFRLFPLAGVFNVAYAMNWNDLDGDGDLDLVTGSYDAGRMLETNGNYLFGAGDGVNVYMNQGGVWQGSQLTTTAQALAIGLWDLNQDQRPDIWVGNDFAEYDDVWLQAAGGQWQPATPFWRYSLSTMSVDSGDLNNDGDAELFATDMKPYNLDPETLAGWLPLMNDSTHLRPRDDAQVAENALQVWRGDHYQNEAYDRGVDAAGWGWSGKFGDLDNDGALDLYVVNGMIAADLFPYLPGGELVEENQALRNDGAGRFTVASAWGLGSTRSGRGMSIADFDQDGDLDIVVNNLNSAAQLFENQLCTEGASIEVDLRWPGTANPFAVGATVALQTDRGVLRRDVRAVSGYLSGDPARLHFGVAPGATLEQLEIRWPDGAVSYVDQPPVDQRLTVTRQS